MPTLEVPEFLLRDVILYAPTRDPQEAVLHVLQDYPRLVAEVRKLRARVTQLDEEGADLDARIAALQEACRAILEL